MTKSKLFDLMVATTISVGSFIGGTALAFSSDMELMQRKNTLQNYTKNVNSDQEYKKAVVEYDSFISQNKNKINKQDMQLGVGIGLALIGGGLIGPMTYQVLRFKNSDPE